MRPWVVPLFASALLPVFAASPLSAFAAEPFGTLSVNEVASELGKAGVYLFDVNTEKVYAEGHIPGARWIPHSPSASDLPEDKGARLVFYCKNFH